MKMEKKNKKHVNICCWCKKEVQKLLEKHLWNRLDLMVESQCWLKIVKAEGCPLEVFITCSQAPCEKSAFHVCLCCCLSEGSGLGLPQVLHHLVK